MIIDKESKGISKKELFEWIGRKIEENSFTSKELIAIESEFDFEFDGAKPE